MSYVDIYNEAEYKYQNWYILYNGHISSSMDHLQAF